MYFNLLMLRSVYYNKCTIENKIPIFLICFCCVILLQTTFGVTRPITDAKQR